MGQRAYPKPERLAAKLLALRRSLGLSQPQMAKRLNFYGYYSRISEFEKGRRQPSLLVLLAYARAANVTVESLIDDEIEVTWPAS